MAKGLGNLIDRVGAKLKLPEFGLSELLAGGRTVNTGDQVLSSRVDPSSLSGENYFTVLQREQGANPYLPPAPATTPPGGPDIAGYDAQQFDLGNYFAVGSTGGTSAQPVYFLGQYFNLANPADRQRYNSVRTQYLNDRYNQYIASEDKALRQDLEEAERSYGQNLADIDLSLDNLSRNRQAYLDESQRNSRSLAEQFRTGQAQRANYFNRLSPNAYQSSQGTSEEYAKGKYDEALADLSKADERALLGFSQDEAVLQRDRGNLETLYNQYISQRRTQSERARQQYFASLQGDLDRGATELAQVSPSSSKFNFNRSPYNPYQAQSVDISEYTPYLDFNALSQSPTANYFKKIGAASTSKLDPLSQHLGYTDAPKEVDHLKNHLTRGY